MVKRILNPDRASQNEGLLSPQPTMWDFCPFRDVVLHEVVLGKSLNASEKLLHAGPG